jgi:hypothetical protein
MLTDEQYNKGGYAKYNLKKEYMEEVHSRTTGPDGKVYRGEAGRQLKQKQLEAQKYQQQHGG